MTERPLREHDLLFEIMRQLKLIRVLLETTLLNNPELTKIYEERAKAQALTHD